MKLYGKIRLDDSGMHTSVKGMHLQQSITGIINQNIVGFNKAGYQKDVPHVSSFAEYIGTHALTSEKNDEVGRIKFTKNTLDCALGTKGYFQIETPNGIKLTRDGRFRLDKDGHLLTVENFKVVSLNGDPIKFDKVPQDIKNIKIGRDGTVTRFDPEDLKHHKVGTISTVDAEGSRIDDVIIKQGYVEESNVVLHEEAYSMITMRRNFQANRQLFIIQNDELSKTLQELGRA